ncbi:unnamed protein product [Thlaspi arvense]|uniref:DUF1985 domain-containing protein n=1 Tax=Thlaspi arvense TaxID=13288 RepID=A0AAU9R6S5_THLAR|nr:unnamed protein product [Thlaspi arvense]
MFTTTDIADKMRIRMESNVLPHHLFADHQEPVGDRVNSYFKLDTLGVILKALTPDELTLIRPCFGKLLDMYHKPAHSDKLAHFLPTRQLKTDRRHELWFIFGGKPVKFSLCKFAIVTGLNCKPISPSPREMLKCKPGKIPYWFTLFGGDENVTGEKLEAMLRRSKNLSSEMKVKYACLLIVDGLLCHKSAGMKIPKDHTEMIQDLDYFLSFPWGRYCFEMTVQCIKSRTTTQLAQATVAVQGFIHSVQLVLLEAVPAVLLTMGEENGSESEEEECATASTLKLDKLWDLDSSGQVAVSSIIEVDTDDIPPDTLEWQDEAPDPKVDYMEMLITEGAEFCRDSFIGGEVVHSPPTQSAVVKNRKRKGPSMPKEKLIVPVRAKKLIEGRNSAKASNEGDPQPITADRIAELIDAAMKTVQSKMADTVASSMMAMESRLERSLNDKMSAMLAAAGRGTRADQVIGDVLRDINAEQETDGMTDELGGRNRQTDDQHDSEEPKTQDIGDGAPITEPVTEQLDDPALSTDKSPATDTEGDSQLIRPSSDVLVEADNPKFAALTHNVSPDRVLNMGGGLLIM